MTFLLTKARDWYGRFEKPISSISLVGGFVFDAVTLKRVDLFWENFWIIVHLVIVAVCIILIHLNEHEEIDSHNPARAHFWYINILQFTFGGLLSAFLVFYFRGSTLSVAWPFLLLLTLAFAANERLKKHYARLTFQISFFYLSLLSFAVFAVPVLYHRIGSDIFLLSGVASLVALALFLIVLHFVSREKFKKSRGMLALSIAGIFIATNLLYFFHFIPPIPLLLKDAGAYHSLTINPAGKYVVQTEEHGFLHYFSMSDTLHIGATDPVYVYSAIFSPAQFTTDIVHDWQKYDERTKEWVTISRVPLSVLGGRAGGFRTYSVKNNISAGEWRVNVETTEGQSIGRVRFTIVETDIAPVLKTEVKG